VASNTYFSSYFNNVDVERSFIAVITLMISFFVLRKGVQKIHPENPLAGGKISLVTDFALSKITEFIESSAGHSIASKHASFLSFLFLTIFILNVIGLIPGVAAPTMAISIPLSLALISFAYFNYYGLKEQGLGYFKHMASPLIDFGIPFKVLALFIFFFELISLLLRILTLTLRLNLNITADHLILDIFVSTPMGMLGGFIPVAFIFYFLGLFVSFIQAFVFFLLNIIYLILATHVDEH